MKRLTVFIMIIMMMVLTSCGKEEATTEEAIVKYSVDYCGSKDCYTGAKKSYRPGKEITLYYDYTMIATDTNYTFYLDDKQLNVTFEDGKGYRIEFTMPDHDVKLEVRTDNSMEALSTEASTETTEDTGSDTPATVTVNYGSDINLDSGNTISVDISSPDSVSQSLVFRTDAPIKDVRLMTLQMYDVDDDGNAYFLYRVAHEEAQLTADKALEAIVTFWGDFPEYGISYTSGADTYYYAVSVSGKDGSVSLMPIKKEQLSEDQAVDNTYPLGTGYDAALAYYQDVIYIYKEAQMNGFVDHTVWDNIDIYTGLEGYGWPNVDLDQVSYSIHDINHDGTPELIISYYGFPVDIYAYCGSEGRLALSRSYKDNTLIYPDGNVQVVSYDAEKMTCTWYELDSHIDIFLPSVQAYLYYDENGNIGDKQYFTLGADGDWYTIEEAYYESGCIPVWAYEIGSEITEAEYNSRVPNDANSISELNDTRLISEFEGF